MIFQELSDMQRLLCSAKISCGRDEEIAADGSIIISMAFIT